VGKRKKSSVEVTLAQLLACQYDGAATLAELSPADYALVIEDYGPAAALFAEVEAPSPTTKAKRGFCLAMAGDDEAAEKLLTPVNVGAHPVAQAVLAWALAGRHGRRLRGFGSTEVMKERDRRRAVVQSLLDMALATDRPPPLVFQAAFEVLRTRPESMDMLFVRARQLYPDWSWAHALHASKRRVAGELDPALLDDLMRTLPSARHEEVFHESYTYAMKLERWDDADRVIEVLEALVRADVQAGDGNYAALAEMRAMVALNRARAGETEAYKAINGQLSPYVPAVSPKVDGRNPLSAPKFLLQVALDTNNEASAKDAACALTERAWHQDFLDGEGLGGWGPIVSTSSMHGVLHFGHFGFDFTAAWRRVDELLTGDSRERWRLLLAADAVFRGDPDPDQVKFLRDASEREGPWWFGQAIFEAYTNHEMPAFDGAGAVLAMLSERSAERSPEDDGRMPSELELLSVDIHGSGDVVRMFEGALAWLQATPSATGTALLRTWGDCLADNGGKAVLAHLATLSLARRESAVARKYLALAEESDGEPLTELEDVLARYPDPAITRVRPEELTLLEAATIIALFRASPLDHIRWTLAPLSASAQRFEPTKKFIGTLFALMDKGVIAVDPSTPAGTLELREDRLHAYLDRVVWRISPNTLELQRAIRDLPHSQWPDAWRSHAPVLALDLGVEELAVYLEYLLEDRSLPCPSLDEVRSIFRVQLEQLAIAQCYYLAHKTMKETLDYQARYRPGVKQLQARVINLLRGNGEKAVANGWDTRYERVRELPASLLYEALHDVLTGWGARAYEEPVSTLRIPIDLNVRAET